MRSNDSRSLVRFGKTDLFVSRLCQGTAFRNLGRFADNSEGRRVIEHCIDSGVNFFDSSNVYGWGGAEKALGKAIAGHRDRVVICTKISTYLRPEGEDKNARKNMERFTKNFLFEQVEGSLKRLATDSIDLYMLHEPDKATPAEDILNSMDALKRSGKIRYWGVSNHSGAQVSKYIKLGKTADTAPIAGIEDYYNIAGESLNDACDSRVVQLEEEMFPVLRQSNLGMLAFSPLEAGLLAPGIQVDPESPIAAMKKAIEKVAVNLGASLAAVSIAWVLHHSEVTCVLAGSESPEHVDDNLAGTELELPKEALYALDAAVEDYRLRQKVKNS